MHSYIFTALLAAVAAALGNIASANEPLAFKSFAMGDDLNLIKKQSGVACAPPLSRSIPKTVTGKERVLAIRTAQLEAIENGDLICKVVVQAIAGQRAEKVTLRLFAEKLLQLEISLRFQAPRREGGSQTYYPGAPEITRVIDALTEKYGAPKDRRQRVATCLCTFVYSQWRMNDGSTVTVERHEESASEARVVFTSAAYDKVSTQRMIATSSVSYEQFKFNQLKAENVRRGNQRDL